MLGAAADTGVVDHVPAASSSSLEARAVASGAVPAVASSAPPASQGGASSDRGVPAQAPPKPAAPKSVAPARLDLFPTERPTEVLEVVARDGEEKSDRDAVILQDGFVHLVGLIPPDVQQRIVDAMRDLGMSAQGFQAEAHDGVKVSKNVERMYLGSLWDASSGSWEATRSDLPGCPAVAEIPKILQDIFTQAIAKANRELKSAANKKRKLPPFPEGVSPGVAVVNWYRDTGASMEMHQDTAEPPAAIASGVPVVGICIGNACDFAYGSERPVASRKPKTLRLESGDVYLFGGAARQLWHGVPKVVPRSAPPYLRLIPGRLNVTLRAL